jgi:hypothetical protein
VDDVILYYIFGKEFGWTPSELQSVPVKTLLALLVLFQASAAREHSAEREALRKVEP